MAGDELVVSPQIKELLAQVAGEPFLVGLIPHLISFVESRCDAVLAERVPGDVAVLELLLKVLAAVIQNNFYDMDRSLRTVIPVLMSLTLQN